MANPVELAQFRKKETIKWVLGHLYSRRVNYMDLNNRELKICSSFLPRDSERSVSHFRTPSHAGIDPGTERDLLSIGQNCPQPGKGSLCLRPAPRGRCFSRRLLHGLASAEGPQGSSTDPQAPTHGLVEGGHEADAQWAGRSAGGSEEMSRRVNGELPRAPHQPGSRIQHPGQTAPPLA